MNNERTVFSQILDFIPRHQFRACVNRYNGNHRTKSFSCFDQYLTIRRKGVRSIFAILSSIEIRASSIQFSGLYF
ncbi:MAG TPA: DUF4372 domain-containing protein [Bacteroidetes bacterium]|nr:DUF4372 domain-containing protein [Bacteroidota bacterium]